MSGVEVVELASRVTQESLLASVQELLAEAPQLPHPVERVRLREAAGMTQARVAQALGTSVTTVQNWENGRTEPKPPRLEAYQELLRVLAERYPADGAPSAAAPVAPQTAPAPAPVPAPVPVSPETIPGVPAAPPAASVPKAVSGEGRPRTAAPARGDGSVSRRPAAGRRPVAASVAVDPRYAHGPLLVLDGDGLAYGAGGLVLECPATTVTQLVQWTLNEPVGAAELNRNGRPSDPLVVLTASAAVRLGLPERLEGREQRAGLRLADDHPVVKQIGKAKWQLTRRGFGPWARIYRPAKDGQRQCVQLALLSWNALETRSWPGVAELEAPEIARVLSVYAARVLTPRGGTAVNGLELMTALRPPTKAVRDESGAWVSGYNPGSLGTRPVDPAPPETVPEHPLAQGWTRGFLDEEPHKWVRDVDLVSNDEALQPFALGLDLNMSFLAAASRTPVGLGAPTHVVRPRFDKAVPGSWLADLSHIDLDPRLPNPFTPSGRRPQGPAWYETHTLAYAQQLGHNVEPTEGYLRFEHGAYLDPWHDRLKAALLATMEDLGVRPGLEGAELLEAMAAAKHGDPGLLAVLAAVKATAKGGIGKLRVRAKGLDYVKGERWPELERPTWRPDIRAAVIAKARVNMHRKMMKMAELGFFPLAVNVDCVVYPAPSESPLDLLPYTAAGKPLPGAFRLGVAPGLVKTEGVQPLEWAVDLADQGGNPAQLIKSGGTILLDDGDE